MATTPEASALNELDEMFDDETEDLGSASDLLDEVPEDDAAPWMPEEEGEGIAGRVVDRFEVPDEMDEDGIEKVPCIILVDDDGERWSIRGYRTVLRKEIRKADPQVGDLFAVKFLGARPIKKGKFAGNDSYIYRALAKKAHSA